MEGGDVMLPAAAPTAEEAEQQDRDLENQEEMDEAGGVGG